jgi:hypothetical protein
MQNAPTWWSTRYANFQNSRPQIGVAARKELRGWCRDLGTDRGELGLEWASDQRHGSDQAHAHGGGDQTIFDCSGTRLVSKKLLHFKSPDLIFAFNLKRLASCRLPLEHEHTLRPNSQDQLNPIVKIRITADFPERWFNRG